MDIESPPNEPVAIIAIGIPGCGKTTTLKSMAERESYTYVNADDIREELTGDPANHTREPAVWSIVHRRIAAALPSHGIVIDATHTRRGDRKKMIAYCREKGANHIVGYWFVTPLEVCMKRNQLRERTVPVHVLETMHRRLQATPPSIDEGFDDIIRVI